MFETHRGAVRAITLLALVLVAGCTPGGPVTGAQFCDIRKAADIPISFEHGLISAPARIEQTPVKLLIDTGAEASLVTPDVVALLHLPPDMQRRSMIEGTDGVMTTRNVLLPSLWFAGTAMFQQSALVAPLPVIHGIPLQAAGLLGADRLRDFDVEFDLPRRRVALYRVQGCTGDYVPWDGSKAWATAKIYGQGLLLLPVRLDGRIVTALLDSGSNHSSLSTAAAARVGVGTDALSLDQTGQSSGVDGHTMATKRHVFDELSVGHARYLTTALDIGTMQLQIADMLLGADWLRRNRVWVSYATGQITIQPEAGQHAAIDQDVAQR